MTDPPKFDCPKCLHVTGLWLPHVSDGAWVDYFRCTDCGHVWTGPKETERRIAPPVRTL